MSSPATTVTAAGTATSTAPTNLFEVIQSDISEGVHWLGAEAQGIGATVWSIFKVAFIALTSAQAQVVVNVLSRLQSDLVAKRTIEQIETDLLGEAMADELAVLTNIESSTLQAYIAAWKAS